MDSCLALVRQLVAAARQQGSPTRVLLAVDDYNSLYGTTEYGVLTSRPDRARRRVLRAEELVLVSTRGRGKEGGGKGLGGKRRARGWRRGAGGREMINVVSCRVVTCTGWSRERRRLCP